MLMLKVNRFSWKCRLHFIMNLKFISTTTATSVALTLLLLIAIKLATGSKSNW